VRVRAGRRRRLLIAAVALALVAAACGDDSDSTSDDAPASGGGVGGELVDLGTFIGDPPEHIDPALNVSTDAYQVVNSLYDGLTEIDATTDPDNPTIEPLVAESFTANDDGSVWTFTIRGDQRFSDGSPVLPSSFSRAWERASDPDFAGNYSYLFSFIEGGQEKLDGEADTLSGVTADDDAMTLTVRLAEPYANFPAVAGFQLFFPMPEAVDELEDQNEWENGLMVGNGPYELAEPRTDEEIVLVRNDEWAGDIFGNETATLDQITFLVSADPDTAYNAFDAGEGDTAYAAPGRINEARDNYATTLDTTVLGSFYFELNQEDPVVGGPENRLLRQAISQAIDREEINEAIYEGTRQISTGITPPGIPGFGEGLCDYCASDGDAAQQAYDEWRSEGNELTEPIEIQFEAGAGHESLIQIIVDNLDAIGLPAVADPMPEETYFTELADGACQVCRSNWNADYPTYDNFTYDLFSTDAIGLNNNGFYSNPTFDDLIDEAKTETDLERQGELFRQAEQILLNDDVGVIPIYWNRGTYVYNPETVTNFEQNNLGLVSWETVTVR
jgi:ABC-type oligopeptide transport system substrate-binding subunit